MVILECDWCEVAQYVTSESEGKPFFDAHLECHKPHVGTADWAKFVFRKHQLVSTMEDGEPRKRSLMDRLIRGADIRRRKG